MTPKFVCRFGVLSGSFLPALVLTAQQPEPLRLSVTTRLVEISVVVEGKGGRPVDDLTKEDFVILDDGKPQTIATFVRSAGARRSPAAGPAQQTGAPRMWSNRETSAVTMRTVTALVFDALNTHVKDQVYMKEQMLRFLRRLRPGDSAAIYTLADDLRVLHDFTDDNESLIHALDHQAPKLLAQWSRETVGGAMRGVLRADRAAFTLSALRAISVHLSRIPGRKNLVWVTTGFPMRIIETQDRMPIYIHDNGPLMASTAKAIADADVALYPVSALGLVGMPERSAAMAGAQGPGGMRGALRTSTPLGPQIIHHRQATPLNDTLIWMAEQTGGQAFTQNNNLAGALEQSLRDLRATYTMSFRPSHDQWNGDFHRLRVQARRKGLKLRARPGYLASPDAPADTRDADAVLMDAFDNPLDATGVGLTVSPAGLDAAGARLRIHVDVRTISLEPSGDRWKAALMLAVVPLASDEAMAQPDVQNLSVDMSRDRHDEIIKTGASFERVVPAKDFTRGVRVFVMDVASRRVGSVNVR